MTYCTDTMLDILADSEIPGATARAILLAAVNMRLDFPAPKW